MSEEPEYYDPNERAEPWLRGRDRRGRYVWPEPAEPEPRNHRGRHYHYAPEYEPRD